MALWLNAKKSGKNGPFLKEITNRWKGEAIRKTDGHIFILTDIYYGYQTIPKPKYKPER